MSPVTPSPCRRIALLGPSGQPGGLQTHHAELTRFLAAEGHALLVVDVALAPGPAIPAASGQVRLRVPFADGKRGRLLKAWGWWRAGRALRRFAPDLVIASACGAGYARAATQRPVGAAAFYLEVTDDWQADDPVRRALVAAFPATAVQSPALLPGLVRRLGPGRPAAVLPCFSQELPAGFCARAPEVNEPLRLAYFGRLAGNKGLDLLLESLARVPEAAAVRLDLWGRGPESARLEALRQSLGLAGRVTLRGGYPEGADYARLLASYHGLVLPSQATEGLPLVLLEAASVGLPFLATRLGAIPDCATDNPDVQLVALGAGAWAAGLASWLPALRAGCFQPQRLQAWHQRHHARAVQEAHWRRCLACPEQFFRT